MKNEARGTFKNISFRGALTQKFSWYVFLLQYVAGDMLAIT